MSLFPNKPTEKKPVSRRAKKLMLWLMLNTVLALVLYFGCIALHFNAIMWIYIASAVVLLLVYVIYNQGFVLRGVTPEMLSDTLSPDEKQAMLADAARRADRSRWMLTVLVPLVFAVLIDAFYLFVLQDALSALDGLLSA